MFLGACVSTAAIAGCIETETIGFGTGNDEGTPENDEDHFGEFSEEFRSILEEMGVEVNELTVNDEYHLELQTSGDVDTDLQRVASAYVTMAEDLEYDLSVRVVDRGLTEATFEIELEWAQEHAEGLIDDAELMARIQETME